ncbi:MAG: GldM family protein [Agriterribacter sp.]
MNTLFRLILTFVLSVAILHAPAQRFLVNNDRQNILQLGLDNPLSVVVDGISCNNVVLITDNGNITAESNRSSSCRYTIKPAREGVAYIQVYKKTKNKLKKIGEIPFRAKTLPPPTAMIGMLDKDTASKTVLIAMGGMRVIQTNIDIDLDY